MPDNQSGFRPNYSCTTALTHITDDIIKATDGGKLTILVLLDFSKAFDTVDHSMLCQILRFIGMHSDSVELLKSYLENRKQMVKLGNV